jgi:Tol biopolymer transport system component
LVYYSGHLTLIGPDGKDEKAVSENEREFRPGGGHRFSPDGKQLAFLVAPPFVFGDDVNKPRKPKVYVRGLEEEEPGTDMEVNADYLSWSPDSKSLVVTVLLRVGEGEKSPEFATWLVDVKTKKKTALRIPSDQYVTDWSSDGKYFLTTELNKGGSRLHVVSRDLTEDRVVTKEGVPSGDGGRFSPVGDQVLYKVWSKTGDARLVVLNLRSRKATQVKNLPANCDLFGYCWSPDGKRIAHAWRAKAEQADLSTQTESTLIVSDADGSNPVTILKHKHGAAGIGISDPDWR